LSLRQVAQRLSRDVQAARRETAATAPWATSERLLVCVGPSPTSARLIRTARRMAAAFGAEWLAVAVEPRGSHADQAAAREQIARHLRLAERLGAETHLLVGDDAAQTLLDLAVERNVTKIVVGKSNQPRWRRLLFGTLVDSLLERSGDIDVYVIRGAGEEARTSKTEIRDSKSEFRKSRIGGTWRYLGAATVVTLCGLIGWGSAALHLSEANIVMVFLLGVAVVATWLGRGPAVAAAIASVIVFDFFFVPPRLTLSVADTEYIITFLVMLLIGMIVSTLTARIHEQLQAMRRLQRRTAALFRLTTQLSEVAGWEFLIHAAGRQLREIFDGEVVIFVRDKNGSLRLRFGEDTSLAKSEANAAVAHWVADHDQVAGLGTDTLPHAAARFVPLVGSQRTIGAVGMRSSDLGRFSDPDQGRLLETCASLIALSLERDQSVLEASEARVRAETEEMRNTLLSSVSHDLRTPLAAIAAASASLRDRDAARDESHRRELLQTIADESHRLTRLVENLLEITRLESGSVEPNKQWHVLEEIIGSALSRVRDELGRRHVHIEIPPDLPLLRLDGVLMEQVFVNLFENAARYAPAGGPIDVIACQRDGKVEVVIADRGPGLPPGSESRLMEKFYRAPATSADGRRGVGLGLAICRAVLQLHGGRISARNRTGGGAEFILELPVDPAAPPAMPSE
jgi:two-component system sensor histidine kinase KdpD